MTASTPASTPTNGPPLPDLCREIAALLYAVGDSAAAEAETRFPRTAALVVFVSQGMAVPTEAARPQLFMLHSFLCSQPKIR